MSRIILTIVTLALLSLAPGSVAGQYQGGMAVRAGDVDGGTQQDGAAASKKKLKSAANTSRQKGTVDRKETITIHGSQGTAAKHKGEIEVQSFGGGQNSSAGWPAKIDWGGLTGSAPTKSRPAQKK